MILSAWDIKGNGAGKAFLIIVNGAVHGIAVPAVTSPETRAHRDSHPDNAAMVRRATAYPGQGRNGAGSRATLTSRSDRGAAAAPIRPVFYRALVAPGPWLLTRGA